jgi:cytochrome d ubiquinol oxidase subunit II
MDTFLGMDYQTWWFLLVGALFTGYAFLDGYDLGAGALHLFFKKENSRRIALNAIGPVWDGNEVWLVIGGGALFAAFPEVYASLFSAFYIPFMLFLVFLIFRGISIEFRGKEPMQWWKNLWDTSYSVSSIVLAILLGVVIGNVVRGIALEGDKEFYGSWLSFLNPFAIVTGLTTLALFTMHGAIYLSLKTKDKLYEKLTVFVRYTSFFFILMLVINTIYTLTVFPHMLAKFQAYPILFIIPVAVVLMAVLVVRLNIKKKFFPSFISSCILIALLLMLVGISLYPNMIRSTVDQAYNLTIYNAASSVKSLRIMLIIAAIGTPLAIFYPAFVFWTFRGKVELDEHSY